MQEEVEEEDEECASESDDSEAKENVDEDVDDSDAVFWKWLHGDEEVATSQILSSAPSGKRIRSQIDVKSKSFVKGGRPAKFHRFVAKDLKPTAVRKNPRSGKSITPSVLVGTSTFDVILEFATKSYVSLSVKLPSYSSK